MGLLMRIVQFEPIRCEFRLFSIYIPDHLQLIVTRLALVLNHSPGCHVFYTDIAIFFRPSCLLKCCWNF